MANVALSDSLKDFDPSQKHYYADESWRPFFKRLRQEAPVFKVEDSEYGPYWVVSTHELVRKVEMNIADFSSSFEWGGINLVDLPEFDAFLQNDPPEQRQKRKVVAPAFTPQMMDKYQTSIRSRIVATLDSLEVGEEFDWVSTVSTELVAQMLAELFDFPFEDRHKLVVWSDWLSENNKLKDPALQEERFRQYGEMLTYFDRMWKHERSIEPRMTLISLLAHSDIFGELPPEERLGTLAILIVGGTDTTRNSMSNMIRAFNMYPDQWEDLLSNPGLLDTAVPEIIRWVTPIMYMRRTATHDFEFGGKQMHEGDKVTIWYLSANQDEEVFKDAEKFIAGRSNAGEHLSFGLGTHRCIGSRLAQLQLRILLEEMIKRQMRVEYVGPITQYGLPSVPGIEHMPVKITRSA